MSIRNVKKRVLSTFLVLYERFFYLITQSFPIQLFHVIRYIHYLMCLTALTMRARTWYNLIGSLGSSEIDLA
jgi:hypothetical protein